MTLVIRIPKGSKNPKKEEVKMARAKSVEKNRDKILKGFTKFEPNAYSTKGSGKRVCITGAGTFISISRDLAEEIGYTEDSYVAIYSKEGKIAILSAQPHEADVRRVTRKEKGNCAYIYCKTLLSVMGVKESKSCSYEYLPDEDILMVTV